MFGWISASLQNSQKGTGVPGKLDRVIVSEERHKKEDPNYDLFMNAQDSAGNTALHMAVFHGKIKAVDWLIDNGARYGTLPRPA